MFQIDSRLMHESVLITTLSLSAVLLRDDERFPWLILVPQRSRVTELYELSSADQHQLIGEIALCSKILKEACVFEKVNIGALGNVVPQLHVHIVGRIQTDLYWPNPVWGQGVREPYPLEDREALVQQLTRAFMQN